MRKTSVKKFHCHDGCLAAMVGEKNSSGKWNLYSISKIYGMGNADYENKVYDTELDDLIGLNSYSGLSYIGTKLNGKWGLIEIKTGLKTNCDWKILADNDYEDFDGLLSKFSINKKDFKEDYALLL